MNNNLLMVFRMIFSVAFLILIAGLLTTTTVQSADPLAINAEITVSPTSGLVTTEAAGTDTFTVVLTAAPDPDTATVRINLSSSNTDEGTVSPSFVEFDISNWFTAQEVTITGVDDSVADGNVAYTIITSETVTTATNYIGVNPSDVSVTNNDNDTAGITVTPTSGLVTTESFGTDTFTVALDTQPTTSVTINLSSSNTNEGTVLPATLVFNSGDWSAKLVTVTGVDDSVDDGDVAYTIITSPAVSGDGNYSGVNPFDVSVTNNDNDTAGITVTPTSGLVTTESFGTDTFTVALDTQPTTSVTINLSSSNTNEGTVLPATLVFNSGDWSAKLVTVTGVDDSVDDGDVAYTIITSPAVSGDGNYSGVNPSDVSVTNNDNDVIGFTITPTTGLLTSESGLTDTFDVVLNTIPTASVTLPLSSSDPSEGTIDKPSLTFPVLDWNKPQTVTITGVDDFIADGFVNYQIQTGPATGGDYNLINPIDVSVTNADNDTPGITTSPNSDLWTSEGGASKIETIQILLQSEPTTPVLLTIESSDTGEGTVSPSSILIDPDLGWPAAPKEFTVIGVDDCKNGGDNYTVTITATDPDPEDGNPIDPNYNGQQEVLQLTNYDAPTIGWVKPVGTEKIYFSDGFSPIDLEVVSLCPEPIEKVKFTRWVAASGYHLIIREDDNPPYVAVIDPQDIESGWTQVFAQAYGLPSEIHQTYSKSERMLILKDFDFIVHLPLVYK